MHVHRSTAPKAIAAIAAVGLIPFGIAFVATLPAAAPPPSTTVQAASDIGTGSYVPAWVAIKTGSASSVTLNRASGTLGSPQTLATAADCGVNQGTAASRFLTFQGATGTSFSEGLASYQSGSIGVKEKKSGTSCYQVNSTSESLRLGLGAGVSSLLGSTAVASSAFLDLELKQSARILATVSLGGVTKGTYELQSGSTIGLPRLPGTTTAPFTCNNPADSGPDSGINDNCRWPISVPSWTGTDDGVFFDTITLKAVAGSFSLEGGGDGTVLPQSPTTTPNASILEIVEGTVACGGETRTEAATGDEPQVTVYRLGNVGTTSCAPVPYTLSNAVKAAQFLKPLDSPDQRAVPVGPAVEVPAERRDDRPSRPEDRLRGAGRRHDAPARLVPGPDVRALGAVPRLQRRAAALGERPGARPRRRPVRLRRLQGRQERRRHPGRHRVARRGLRLRRRQDAVVTQELSGCSPPRRAPRGAGRTARARARRPRRARGARR